MDEVIDLRKQQLPAILNVALVVAHGRVYQFALTRAHGRPVLIDQEKHIAWLGDWESIIHRGASALLSIQQREKTVCH